MAAELPACRAGCQLAPGRRAHLVGKEAAHDSVALPRVRPGALALQPALVPLEEGPGQRGVLWGHLNQLHARPGRRRPQARLVPGAPLALPVEPEYVPGRAVQVGILLQQGQYSGPQACSSGRGAKVTMATSCVLSMR